MIRAWGSPVPSGGGRLRSRLRGDPVGTENVTRRGLSADRALCTRVRQFGIAHVLGIAPDAP